MKSDYNTLRTSSINTKGRILLQSSILSICKWGAQCTKFCIWKKFAVEGRFYLSRRQSRYDESIIVREKTSNSSSKFWKILRNLPDQRVHGNGNSCCDPRYSNFYWNARPKDKVINLKAKEPKNLKTQRSRPFWIMSVNSNSLLSNGTTVRTFLLYEKYFCSSWTTPSIIAEKWNLHGGLTFTKQYCDERESLVLRMCE